MLRPGDRVLAGVSGGADSVCLLLVLQELGYEVAVAHLNHGLRGAESDADEVFVRELACRLGLMFHSRHVNIRAVPGNVEAAGRGARKEFFAALVEQHGFDRIALGHHRDDRVETFLIHLLRGSGADGLSSMGPVAGIVIRPLLEVSRLEIESFLRNRSQNWRQDSSNLDAGFARNRLRHEIIPDLTTFNPRLSEALTRTIEVLEGESNWLQQLTGDWLARHGTRNAAAFVVDALRLALEPVALQRRVVRGALKAIADEGVQGVGFGHVESVRGLLGAARSGRVVQIPGGVTVTRSFGQLIVQKRSPPPAEFDYELPIPGEVYIAELGATFQARIVPEENGNSIPGRVFVDGGVLGPYVRIRNWKPGDYYRPVGLPSGKVKKLFQSARIPRSQRYGWPVLVTEASIVWVASFPVSREFASRECSLKIVAIEVVPG